MIIANQLKTTKKAVGHGEKRLFLFVDAARPGNNSGYADFVVRHQILYDPHRNLPLAISDMQYCPLHHQKADKKGECESSIHDAPETQPQIQPRGTSPPTPESHKRLWSATISALLSTRRPSYTAVMLVGARCANQIDASAIDRHRPVDSSCQWTTTYSLAGRRLRDKQEVRGELVFESTVNLTRISRIVPCGSLLLI